MYSLRSSLEAFSYCLRFSLNSVVSTFRFVISLTTKIKERQDRRLRHKLGKTD